MNNFLKQKGNFLLILILAVASVLRFYHYYEWSLSNDELSALNRLRYDNLKDIVKFGVMLNDMHPAGVQIFLFYWVKIFGLSEASIRFPFIITGIISVYITYLIAKKWFNETSALLASSALAVLQFPILYSQLSRPYSPGLLFSLLTVLFFTKFLFDKNGKNFFNYIGFILSFTFAAYSHHYSFLFVIMVWATGLLFLNKTNWKQYLSMPFIIFILYFPNLKVFIYQFFGKGGLGGADGWLGKPDNNFFFDYLHYCFNNSIYIIGLIILIFILYIILIFRNLKFSKFQVISLTWFLLHFFIAFFYSIFKNPILQYSILIFSFPFLLIFIFSFLPEIKIKLKLAAVLIILIFGTFNTVISNSFYNTNHFADFKSIANTIISLDDKYGYNNITRTINCNGPYYIDYYFSRKNRKVSFAKYQNVGGEDYLELKKILSKSKTNYFLNAVTQLGPPEVEDIIKTQYPYIIEDYNFSISSVTLYSKTKPLKPIERKLPCKIIFNGFENKNNFWSNDTLHLSSEKVKDGKFSFKFDSLVEYGPTFRENCKKFQDNKNIKSYKISLDVYSDNEINNATLVFQITSNDKIYVWRGALIHNFFEKGKWNKVFLNWILPDIKSDDYVVSIYVWNPKKENFYTDNIEIKLFTEKLW